MKTMTAKFPGTCAACGGSIQRGEQINFFGRGRAEHAHQCGAPAERKPDAPCWICKAPEGFFRARGAATPVWCDACNAEQCKNDIRTGTTTILNASRIPDSSRSRYGSNYTRFSSGAEVFTNKRGRCEDAPCCGCCS